MPPAPRLFCIPATAAPVVAVIRRGPSPWHHVGRWDLDALSYEPGAWFKGRIYPQKCDLSPDGRWFAYSALDMRADWPAGTIYEAISRLPWLHALAAWEMGTTYTRGIHFVERPGRAAPVTKESAEDDEVPGSMGHDPPDVGDASPCLKKYGIHVTRPTSFAVERRRSWSETDDTPALDPGDRFDEQRPVRMQKSQPGGSALLEVEGSYAAHRDIPHLRTPAQYTLTRDEKGELLDVQWADWDTGGRLLVATSDGRVQVRVLSDDTEIVFDHDLSGLEPDPRPAPHWAREW